MADWLRPPDIRLVVKEVEAGRHDADDRSGRLIQDQRFSDYVAVTIEMAPPEPVADEHHRRVVVDLIFGIGENAPQLRLHPDDPEHGRRERLYFQTFGRRSVSFRTEVLDAAIERTERLVRLAFVPEMEI